MDETAIAFAMPHERAAFTAGGLVPDRISVRDYTRTVEIGAFSSERGVCQRIRFNVVLEVSHHTAAQDDDVDKVISYDTITEAIEAELAAERVNLLETLAERVSGRCLADPRAVRVFVRIEKLDRIPGALGVEIMRIRAKGDARPLHPVIEAGRPVDAAPRPRVIYLPRKVLSGPDAALWREALSKYPHPFIACVAPAVAQQPASSEAQRRIGLLAIEQEAWRFVDGDRRFDVAASRTELDWALKSGRHSVWAPCKMIMDTPHRPDADAAMPRGLAVWLAQEVGADVLVVAGDPAPGAEAGLEVIGAETPRHLACTA